MLNSHHKPRSIRLPPEVRHATNRLNRAHENFKRATEKQKESAETVLYETKKSYRSAIRKQNHKESLLRDQQLFSICTDNPSKFKVILNYLFAIP